jgi:hypothetical protein
MTNHVILAGKQMPEGSILSWTNKQIKVEVPDDVGLFPQGPEIGAVSITTSGSQSNSDFSFLLESFLDELSFKHNGTEYEITLTGTSLGNDPGALLRSTAYEHISLNGERIPNGDVGRWSNNEIIITVPDLVTSGSITVTSNGYESNSLSFIGSSIASEVFMPLLMKNNTE